MKKREKHGLTKHPLYSKWQDMRNTCYNKNRDRYKSYGGRGVRVCNEWNESFKSFYNWCIKNNYEPGLSIERVDVNGDYSPKNCKLIKSYRQSYNKQSTKFIKYQGKKYCLSELIKILFPFNYTNAYKAIWWYLNKNEISELTPEIELRYRKIYSKDKKVLT